MNDELLARYARLIVEIGANIQRGQVVWIVAEPRAAPLVRAIAAAAYDARRALRRPVVLRPGGQADPRSSAAPEDSLDFVPSWYGQRLLDVGEQHGSRISITPDVPPGLLDGIDPARAGRDQLPARRRLRRDQRPNDELVRRAVGDRRNGLGSSTPASTTTLRSRRSGSSSSSASARRARRRPPRGPRASTSSTTPAGVSTRTRFDALHFEGPGTDLTVGLLPTSRFSSETPGMQTVDGIIHFPNLPSEEIAPARPASRRRRRHGDEAARRLRDGDRGPAHSLRGRAAIEIEGRTPTSSGVAARRTRALAPRRGRARRSRGPHRPDRHGLLQHAARRERREPSRLWQCLCDLGGRSRSRPHQHECDPHRLHGRLERRRRHRRKTGRDEGARPPRRDLAARNSSTWLKPNQVDAPRLRRL